MTGQCETFEGRMAAVPGRALVLVPSPARSADTARRSAGFLAQLFACERRFAPYRVANREAPEAASRAYAPPAFTVRARLLAEA